MVGNDNGTFEQQVVVAGGRMVKRVRDNKGCLKNFAINSEEFSTHNYSP